LESFRKKQDIEGLSLSSARLWSEICKRLNPKRRVAASHRQTLRHKQWIQSPAIPKHSIQPTRFSCAQRRSNAADSKRSSTRSFWPAAYLPSRNSVGRRPECLRAFRRSSW